MSKAVRLCGLLFGGNANNGANAGFAYANSNNTPSNANANIGSHLCSNTHGGVAATLRRGGRRPRLLAKKFTDRKVLVGMPVVWAAEGSEYVKQRKQME